MSGFLFSIFIIQSRLLLRSVRCSCFLPSLLRSSIRSLYRLHHRIILFNMVSGRRRLSWQIHYWLALTRTFSLQLTNLTGRKMETIGLELEERQAVSLWWDLCVIVHLFICAVWLIQFHSQGKIIKMLLPYRAFSSAASNAFCSWKDPKSMGWLGRKPQSLPWCFTLYIKSEKLSQTSSPTAFAFFIFYPHFMRSVFAGWPIQDSKAVPVYWLAGARRA